MEKIEHKYIEVNGLNLHVALAGTGEKVVLFLHGFPEIWYTWRHQMVALANAGFRAIALDFRGYGLSDQPLEPSKASFDDFVKDVIGLLDSLGSTKVFLVGKDFGSVVVSLLAVFHPERVSAFITIGVPFVLPGPAVMQNDILPKGFYVTRWQEPGRAEADFDRFDAKTVIRKVYIMFSGTELPVAREDQEIMDLVDENAVLPPWLTEEDLSVYGSLYEKSGFHTGLQVPYRCIGQDLGIENAKVRAPAMLIMGEKTLVLKLPGMEDYIKSGKVKEFVPDLEVTIIPEGTHFMPEQLPDKVNHLILSFVEKHASRLDNPTQ